MKEDEDEESNLQTTKYNVMPSRMGLQVMKNRLTLALLGKKLMKWTVLATAKELRKVSIELVELSRDYEAKTSKAFIDLARARYFYPNFNSMILENVPTEAKIYIQTSNKILAGVKIRIVEPVFSPDDAYPFMGIGKGGRAIDEAKESWIELLRLYISVAAARVMYESVDNAHRSAKKRGNVLGKLIIPKIRMTMKYIESELDEQEREETFRLKRFKELKTKKLAQGKPPPRRVTVEEPAKVEPTPMKEETSPEEDASPKIEEIRQKDEEVPLKDEVIMFKDEEKPFEDEEVPYKEEEVSYKEEEVPYKEEKVPYKEEETPYKQEEVLIQKPYENPKKTKSEHLLAHLQEVIRVAKELELEELVTPSMEQFVTKYSERVKPTRLRYLSDCEICRYMNSQVSSLHPHEEPPKEPLPCAAPLHEEPDTSNYPEPCSCSHSKSDAPSQQKPMNGLFCSAAPDVQDNEFGKFETKYKEIIKVSKHRNPDGTIQEKRKVIQITTEKKLPVKPDNTHGEEYKTSCTRTNSATSSGFSSQYGSAHSNPQQVMKNVCEKEICCCSHMAQKSGYTGKDEQKNTPREDKPDMLRTASSSSLFRCMGNSDCRVTKFADGDENIKKDDRSPSSGPCSCDSQNNDTSENPEVYHSSESSTMLGSCLEHCSNEQGKCYMLEAFQQILEKLESCGLDEDEKQGCVIDIYKNICKSPSPTSANACPTCSKKPESGAAQSHSTKSPMSGTSTRPQSSPQDASKRPSKSSKNNEACGHCKGLCKHSSDSQLLCQSENNETMPKSKSDHSRYC